MDVQQLRSWIFELFDPLTQDRTYIVFEHDGALLIDLPPFDRRALLRILGTCTPSRAFFTHAGRARDAEQWRSAIPELRFAIHEADAGSVPGGVDVAVKDGEDLTRSARVVHVGGHTPGASALLVRRQGGVLFPGDAVVGTPDGRLRLPDASYADPDKVRAGIERLRALEFSSVLSTHGNPVWSAGKEKYLLLLEELPKAHRRFGYLTDAPWDLAYRGRLQDQMVHNPLMPEDQTIEEAAGHGPSTLVPAWQTRPAREVEWAESAAPAAARVDAAPPGGGRRWSLAQEGSLAMAARPRGAVETIPTHLAQVTTAHRRLSADELAASGEVDWRHGSLDLSRDGREVVFAWNADGHYEIYRAPIEGDAIFQLTNAGRRSVQPRLSPDARWIAFLRDADGDDRFGVWLIDRSGAHERQLGSGPWNHWSLSWSPDGARLALVSDAEGSVGIWTVEVESERAIRVVADLSPTVPPVRPRWSPDGRFISYHAAPHGASGSDVYLVPADASAKPWRLETGERGVARTFWPAWSPRGDLVAFTTDARGRVEIAFVPVRDGRAIGRARHLREGHFDDFDAVWQPEGDRVLYHRAWEGAITVRRAYTVSLNDEPAFDAPGSHRVFGVRADGLVAYLWSGPGQPTDVYVKARQEIAPRAITRSLPRDIDPALFVTPRHVRYPAADGLEIPALLYLPHDEALAGRPRAAVVYAHDGPHGFAHSLRFDPWAQWLANQGYAVLAANVRGSIGYGSAFAEANRDLGGADVDDLARGAEWLASEGVAERDRIATFGIGYGGYLALRALAVASERFAAGCAVGAFVRWPVAEERSLARTASAIRAPVLLIQGRGDPHASLDDAQAFVEALREAGRAFAYRFYDGEGAEPRETTNRRDAFERLAEFLDLHVRGGVAAPV